MTDQTWVYLVRAGKDYKIGITKNIKARIRHLSNANSQKVHLIHSFDAYHATSWEEFLHCHFKHRHIRGEWFRLTPEDVDWIKRIEGVAMPLMGSDDRLLHLLEIEKLLKDDWIDWAVSLRGKRIKIDSYEEIKGYMVGIASIPDRLVFVQHGSKRRGVDANPSNTTIL